MKKEKKNKKKQLENNGVTVQPWSPTSLILFYVIKLWGVSMVLPETEAANFLSCDMDKSIKLWENFAISNVLCRFYRFIS